MAQPLVTLEICRPTEEHARLIMAWRNDPATLAASFHQEPKVWEEFWSEYQAEYFRPSLPPPVFVLAHGERVGFLRFRPAQDPLVISKKCVEVSINISPKSRGGGFGPAALQAAEEYLACLGYEGLLAEVFTDNPGSRSCFTRAGYQPLDEVDHVVAETSQVFRVVRLWRAIRALRGGERGHA